MDAPLSDLQYCSECGRPWPFDELAHFGNRLICADCKNAYAQKLREGVPALSTLVYAGFWIRFLAALIDGVILYVAGMILQLPLIGLLRSGRIGTPIETAMLMGFGIRVCAGFRHGRLVRGSFPEPFLGDSR